MTSLLFRRQVSWLASGRAIPGSQVDNLFPNLTRCFSNIQERTGRRLDLDYDGGRCKLIVPIPQTNSFDEERSFTLHPDITVGQLVKDIASENEDEIKNVEVVDIVGTPVPSSANVLELTTTNFSLRINDTVFPVIPPVSAIPAEEMSSDVGAMEMKAKIVRVRRELQANPRRTIRYTEFVDLCASCDVSEEAAGELITHLHEAGVVLHYKNSDREGLRSRVFLHPEEVTEDFYRRVGRRSPASLLASEQATVVRERLARSEEELKAMLAVQAPLDAMAVQRTGRYMWGVAAFVTGGAGWYWWLSYCYFSWDIMEPVTYFTGLGMGTLAYFWWAATSSELDYTDAYEFLVKRQQKQLYAQAGYDVAKRDALKKEKDDIEVLQRQLVLTGYNPGLFSLFEVQHLQKKEKGE